MAKSTRRILIQDQKPDNHLEWPDEENATTAKSTVANNRLCPRPLLATTKF